MSNGPPSKAALRTQVAAALASLSPASIATQSAAVMAHLQAVVPYGDCRSASVYLPMAPDGKEVDTWPIVADLLARGASVAVPRVGGPQPTDMRMLRLSSLEQARGFPHTKWGIPEPSAADASAMEDATEAPDVAVLLVPAVAFDARCGRLGHVRALSPAPLFFP